MGRVIKFPKEYKETLEEEIATDMDKLYEEFYSNPDNYKLDSNEYEGESKILPNRLT